MKIAQPGAVYPQWSAGLSASPKPGRSNAIARAKPPILGRRSAQSFAEPGPPWTRTTASSDSDGPASNTRVRSPWTCNSLDLIAM
jgi:hypothetical protein